MEMAYCVAAAYTFIFNSFIMDIFALSHKSALSILVFSRCRAQRLIFLGGRNALNLSSIKKPKINPLHHRGKRGASLHRE